MDAVEGTIIPLLKPFPGPNSVLVLDNCGIHHTYEQELYDMVHSVGAELLFLAPYSPIDNPIETGFNVVKSCWKRHQDHLNTLNDVEKALRWCLTECYTDPAASAVLSFQKCGYP
mmetsp:Transcript_12721/g.16429  ORF Transcript_12721/g.16429 Transcript_12721/m.16429 type:complete len:115 (+) Transcript_12721:467-811(+)